MIVTDRADIPPPRIESRASEPVLSRSGVDAWSVIRRLTAEVDPPLAEGSPTPEPADQYRSGQLPRPRDPEFVVRSVTEEHHPLGGRRAERRLLNRASHDDGSGGGSEDI